MAAEPITMPEMPIIEVEAWGKRDEMPKLIEALAKAQAEFEPVKKTEENAAFKRDGKVSKYADLAGAIDATRPALTKHGLAVVQLTGAGEGAAVVTTLLLHTSGAGLRSVLPFPVAQWNAHGVGGGLTYARRYAYLGIVCAAAEDDDGNIASGVETKGGKGEVRTITQGKPQHKADGNAAKLIRICREHNVDLAKASTEMVTRYGVRKADELTPLQFDELVKWASGAQQAAQ